MTDDKKNAMGNWFEKLLPSRIRTDSQNTKRNVPEGLWIKCDNCGAALYRPEYEANLEVCPQCGQHGRIGARQRLDWFLDHEARTEIATEIEPTDILDFFDSKPYTQRLTDYQSKTEEKDALIVMQGKLCDIDLVAAAFEFNFMGGSMGSVVGAKFVKAVEAALDNQAPLVCFTASGGARMQEGLFSLMQMSKTSAALGKLSEARLPYIVVLTDPTMGGVSASLAMLGDVQLAEPNALIGFAGARVIEQTVREKLPKGFQRSEFLLEHGFIDAIVDRRELRQHIAQLLAMLLQREVPICPNYVPATTAEIDESLATESASLENMSERSDNTDSVVNKGNQT